MKKSARYVLLSLSAALSLSVSRRELFVAFFSKKAWRVDVTDRNWALIGWMMRSVTQFEWAGLNRICLLYITTVELFHTVT